VKDIHRKPHERLIVSNGSHLTTENSMEISATKAGGLQTPRLTFCERDFQFTEKTLFCVKLLSVHCTL